MTRPSPRLLLAVLLIVVAGVYAQAATAPFFWDDRALILRSNVVREGLWGEALLGNLWSVKGDSPYYRPLVLLSFVLDYRLFGEAPVGYHLHSLLWHLGASVTLYALAERRVGPWRALAAGLVFALHPVQSEAVLWIAARNDLMCAAGVFGALWALDRGGRGAVPLAVGFATIAVLGKELGLLLPVLAALWRIAWGERPRARDTIVLSAVAVGFLLLRHFASGVATSPPPEPMMGWPAAVAHTVVQAASWITVPWPLTSNASLVGKLTPLVWVGAGLTTLGALALLRAAPRRSAALLAAAALTWAPTVLPSVATSLIGERYLYLPMGFVGVAVAAAVPLTRGVLVAATGLGFTALVVLGVRMSEWESEYLLLRTALERSPNAYVWVRWGNQNERMGQPRDAFRAYLAAIQADPPWRAVCPDPVRILLQHGAYAPAADLAAKLATEQDCDIWPEFGHRRLRALVLAGRLDEANAYVEWLRKQGRPLPDAEMPVKAALCDLTGDLACAQELALRYPDGPTAMAVAMFDMEHPPRPPEGSPMAATP